jgi:L-lactate utilization protein LutC
MLERLRFRQRDATVPEPWVSRRRYGNLATQFGQALTSAGGEVRFAGSLEEAFEQVSLVLAKIGAIKGIANNQPPLSSLDLPVRWPNITWQIAGNEDTGVFRSFSAEADIGLSSADAALAETGTVVVSSGPGLSRLAALLPPVHLALVPVSCLTTDIFAWTASRQGQLPSAVTLISGPSKTADIEQTMATGVHGPKRFIVVLYEDRNG